LTNDGLIAMSAVRHGVIVLTINGRDFARIAEVRPEFQWELMPPERSG
jgi:predicted nucleic acid-binding protein